MFCGMVTIGGARGLHDRRSGRSVMGSRLLDNNRPMDARQLIDWKFCL